MRKRIKLIEKLSKEEEEEENTTPNDILWINSNTKWIQFSNVVRYNADACDANAMQYRNISIFPFHCIEAKLNGQMEKKIRKKNGKKRIIFVSVKRQNLWLSELKITNIDNWPMILWISRNLHHNEICMNCLSLWGRRTATTPSLLLILLLLLLLPPPTPQTHVVFFRLNAECENTSSTSITNIMIERNKHNN